MVGCCSEAAVVLSTRATPTTVESVVACCGGLVTQLEMQNLRCGVCVCVCVCVYIPRDTGNLEMGNIFLLNTLCRQPFSTHLQVSSTICLSVTSDRFQQTGGSSTTLTGDPTKRVKVCADVWYDQPDVPVFRDGTRLSPEPHST